MPPDVLPRDARLIALLISSCPAVADAQPAVLLQLLEFAHRYTAQVLSDALVYSEHAGRGGSLNEEDVKLAVQSRVGWEFGGKIPKEYLLSLASKTNAKPLPAVPEVFGVRLPASKNCLTAVDFDLIPNKPPPGVKLDEDDEEEEDDDEDEPSDEDYDEKEFAGNGDLAMADNLFAMTQDNEEEGTLPQPHIPVPVPPAGEEQEEEDLFGDEDEEEEMAAMEDVSGDALDLNGLHPMVNGAGTGVGEKRKVDDEDDDYDA